MSDVQVDPNPVDRFSRHTPPLSLHAQGRFGTRAGGKASPDNGVRNSDPVVPQKQALIMTIISSKSSNGSLRVSLLVLLVAGILAAIVSITADDAAVRTSLLGRKNQSRNRHNVHDIEGAQFSIPKPQWIPQTQSQYHHLPEALVRISHGLRCLTSCRTDPVG